MEREKRSGICERMKQLFGVQLDAPVCVRERGELIMTYRGRRGVRSDLSSAGRGLQRTLLLLAHMAANPGAVLLLDEPEAHLEILRHRRMYRVLTEVARECAGQLIMASHTEAIQNEAAWRDVVVAFLEGHTGLTTAEASF